MSIEIMFVVQFAGTLWLRAVLHLSAAQLNQADSRLGVTPTIHHHQRPHRANYSNCHSSLPRYVQTDNRTLPAHGNRTRYDYLGFCQIMLWVVNIFK